MIRLESFVSGRWVAGAGRLATLVNPATEEAIAETSSEGVDFGDALAHGRAAGAALRALTFADRAGVLKAMAKVLHTHREELLDLAQRNGGNTRGDAKFDVDGAIGTLSAYAVTGEQLGARVGDRTFLLDGDAIQLARNPRFVGQHIYTTRPGVAVHINAFNFPAWGTFEKVAVAILAGVPVITKPATATALVTWRAVRLLVESGCMPVGALQLVCGSTGNLLSLLGPQDHLAFTGSNATGSALRSSPGFAQNAVRVAVEADSLNAAVCGPDIEIGGEAWSTLLRNVVQDMTQKTGQKCTAVRRVFLPASHAGAFEEALVDALSGVVVGDPTTDGVTMGPVSTSSQLRDARAGISLLAEGNRVVTGGPAALDGKNAPAGKGYYVRPTVISGANSHTHDLEVFGPCVSLLPYDGTAAGAASAIGAGKGSLVSSFYADDRAWIGEVIAGAAPWLGRMLICGSKVADMATPPGMVLPSMIHGGPGRAGGGEELGGERGLLFYMQKTAVAGDRVVLGKIFGTGE